MTWSTGRPISTRHAKLRGRRQCGRPQCGRRAFTLVELVLVMVVILAALAMAAPRLDRFSRGRVLASHAQIVLNQLHAARDRAASRATPCRVIIDLDERVSRIVEQRGGAYVAIDSTVGKPISFPRGVAITIDRMIVNDNSDDSDDESDDADRFEDGGAEDQASPSMQYVEVSPTGVTTPCRIRLRDVKGRELHVIARTRLEAFRIVGATETEDEL